jgi:hypothetical protein
MQWLIENIRWIVGFAGVWTLGNGILHDIFVLKQGRPFELELIHLLIDGHILIFAGVLFLICVKPLTQGSTLAIWICIATSIFILGYCALILKLLPAVGMIVINLLVLVTSIAMYVNQK